MNSKKLARISLLSALAIICGYIESLIPVVLQIPGIKLGISNAVILFAIYKLDKSTAFFIMLIKVTVSALLFSGVNVFIYSICGGILSLLVMITLKKLDFSVVTVSMTGAVAHNIGQLFAAAFMLKTFSVFYYLSPLLLSGLIFGFITGIVCKILIRRLLFK